jgi:predicted amino acid racemase
MTIADIERLEDRLRKAMLESDVAELDRLLSERLRFVTLEGANVGKAADLALHRSRAIHLSALTPLDHHVELCGAETALVNVAVEMAGSVNGVVFSGRFRYTRVWREEGGRIQVLAGQVCAIR